MVLLKTAAFKAYIDKFNNNDEELYVPYINNASAWDWLEANIPFFECPDKNIEETYYFRWWTYRKHIKNTPDGFVISEFLPNVPWAGTHNTINASAGHHIYEGRWLKDSRYLEDYIRFWYKKGGALRSYSSWLTDAVWQFCAVSGDLGLALELLPDFVSDYREREKTNLHPSGLFWSSDDRDAMEYSISGDGLRPTLNSYMYACARAISKIGKIAGKTNIAAEFEAKAAALKKLIQEKLWDGASGFYKVFPIDSKDRAIDDWSFGALDKNRNVREQIGFIPWYFNLPDPGYESAWAQITSNDGFFAPFGPATAEQRHPMFLYKAENHECLWNGQSWPFATSQTLTAFANLLRCYKQNYVDKTDYFKLLSIYTMSHRLEKDGKEVNWIDENLDPLTGSWTSRAILKKWGWPRVKGGYERGKDYNHSTYCDLIISGLIGLLPNAGGAPDINPLVPDEWDFFCLDSIRYHGKSLTVIYDKDGSRYGKGAGLTVFLDGEAHIRELI